MPRRSSWEATYSGAHYIAVNRRSLGVGASTWLLARGRYPPLSFADQGSLDPRVRRRASAWRHARSVMDSLLGVVLILISAGWSAQDLDMALCVVMEESEGLPTAHIANEREDSRGLFQLNIRAWRDGEWPGAANRPIPPLDPEAAFDPIYNARYALVVYEKWGWEPWSTSETCARIVRSRPESTWTHLFEVEPVW
ncbi:MAG: hypothetical protein F4056_05560 [Chloroflexi bacterium]|nr:hypothetical protein [Chloroflexota bacterium]